MGNVLCCLSSRENPLDDFKNPQIQKIKKDEISYKKSKAKNKNRKISLTNKTNLTTNNNDKEPDIKKDEEKDKKTDLDKLTKEIQEKIFATKEEKLKDSLEKTSKNKQDLEETAAKPKSAMPNAYNKKSNEEKSTSRSGVNREEEDTLKEKTNKPEQVGESSPKPTARKYSSNSFVQQKRKSFIGGPLKLKNHKKDVEYLNIEIFVDYFDMNNFDTEIYGPYFQPYLDISFNNEKSRLVAANENQGDNSKNESINFSNLSNIDISMNNTSNNGSFILNSSKLGSVYNFKVLRKFSIEKKKLENFDVNVEFSLKNNCKFKNGNSNNIYSTIPSNFNYKDTSFNLGPTCPSGPNFNSSGLSNNSINLNSTVITGDNIPIVLIGSGFINLNKFYSEMPKKMYDCFLELKLRKALSIGFLKLIINIEEIDKNYPLNPSNNISSDIDGVQSEFGEWLEKNKNENANENFYNNGTNNKLINMDNLNLWENNYVNAPDLPDLVCEDFFNTDFKFAPGENEDFDNNNNNNNYQKSKIITEERSKKSENSKKLNKTNNNNNDNSFIDLNLYSVSEYKIIGINKSNYIGKNEASSNKKQVNAEADKMRVFDRMKITDVLIKNKSYILANEMKVNLKDLKISAELLCEVFEEEIASKINVNKNGNFEINQNYGNKDKIDLSKYNMYQFLLVLANLSLLEKFDLLVKFFDILSEEDKIVFFQITSFERFNVYIYRNYLTLMSNYIIHFKNHLDEGLRYRINIDQRVLIKSVFAILDNIKIIELNHKEIWERYVFEIKDCLISALNLIWDLCHEPLENTEKKKDTKKESAGNDPNKNKNKSNEMTNIYKNCLHTLTYRNKLIFLLKPFLNRSEVIGIIYKIFRKCFQNLTNMAFTKLIDLSQFCEFPEKIAESLIESLIDGDNKNSFIRYLEIIMLKYTHYPEVVKNCYSILLCILKKANEDHLSKFLLIFDLKKFQSSFEIYRFKLRSSTKEINLFFINILYILVSFFQKKSVKEKLLDSEEYQDPRLQQNVDFAFREKYGKILDFLANSFASFFDTTHRRYIEFVKKKFLDLQIQDLLLKIGSVLFIYESNMEIIMQSDFMNNLVRFLLEFAFGKCEFRDLNAMQLKNTNLNSGNQNSGSTGKPFGGFNYISYVNEKKMRNIETIKKFVSSIILSAFDIYKNLLEHDNKYFAEVGINLTKYKIDESDKLIKLFEYCLEAMDRHNINLSLHKKVLKEIMDSFENQDEEEEHEDEETN